MKTLKKDFIKSIKAVGDKDQYGNQSYLIKFQNGDEGYFKTQKEPPSQDAEFEYEIESLPTKQDPSKFYSKITRPGQQGFKGNQRPQELPEHKIIGFAASYVKDLIIADKIEMKDFETEFDRWYNKMKEKI